MAVGRIISGRAVVVEDGVAVPLSATRCIVRDLQIQAGFLAGGTLAAGGSSVSVAGTQQGVILPGFNADPPTVVFPGPLDLRRVFVNANSWNQVAVWIATEAE